MILRVMLDNYASFGDPQTAELQPITIVVGANNSGKTNFLRFVDVLRPKADGQPRTDPDDFGRFFHRPLGSKTVMAFEWEVQSREPAQSLKPAPWTFGRYRFEFRPLAKHQIAETIWIDGKEVFIHSGRLFKESSVSRESGEARFDGTHIGAIFGVNALTLADRYSTYASARAVRELTAPVASARHVHLRVEAIRADTTIVPSPELASDGSNVAAVLAHWLMECPEKALRFNSVLESCIPEMKRVLCTTAVDGHVRLLFEQKDGERFDASQVSDGVLVFAGLIAHALDAPPSALVTLEEPERGIHPRRLAEFVELLRTLVQERQTQFILATHSPVLLNQFHDEPEAILLFRRSPRGTLISRLSDKTEWAETLTKADPGDLLVNGVFNEEGE